MAEGPASDLDGYCLGSGSREHRALDQYSFTKADARAALCESLWNHPGDTIYVMVTRSESIVRTPDPGAYFGSRKENAMSDLGPPRSVGKSPDAAD